MAGMPTKAAVGRSYFRAWRGLKRPMSRPLVYHVTRVCCLVIPDIRYLGKTGQARQSSMSAFTT